MRIAVVGAGGVGGGFGAALAKAGADVTFIARGAHLAAMKSEGLRVNSPRGDTHLVPTQATDDPASIGKVDVVLFCVKLWDVESAGAHIKPLVGPGTAVIPLQNGIDAADRLLPILGRDAVMGGVAQISASIIKPGVISQVGTFMRMIFGELDGKISKRGEDFLALCQKAGFDATLSEQILTELWMKFILLATNASITASTRQPIGKLRDDPDIRSVIVAAVKEVHAVAKRQGHRAAGGCRRQGARFHRPRAARDEGLDGARSRARQPDGAALARRQGGRTRPRARRADADPRHDVCAAEAVRHGNAGLSDRVLTRQRIASMPLRRMTSSNTSAGPLGRFAPRSSWET